MKESFKKLGFEEKESHVFLCCLENSKVTPTFLSKVTGIKRSTVYFYLEKLEQKGLIHYNIQGKKRFIVAENPDFCVQNIISHKKQEVLSLEKEAQNIQKELEHLIIAQKVTTNIQHFQGRQGVKAVLKLILEKKKDVFWMGNLSALLSVISEEELYRLFTLERMKQQTTTYAITSNTIKEKKQFGDLINNFRQFRFVESLSYSSLFGIIDNLIVLFSYEGKKINIVLIEDSAMANMVLFLFKSLWNYLPK